MRRFLLLTHTHKPSWMHCVSRTSQVDSLASFFLCYFFFFLPLAVSLAASHPSLSASHVSLSSCMIYQLPGELFLIIVASLSRWAKQVAQVRDNRQEKEKKKKRTARWSVCEYVNVTLLMLSSWSIAWDWVTVCVRDEWWKTNNLNNKETVI